MCCCATVPGLFARQPDLLSISAGALQFNPTGVGSLSSNPYLAINNPGTAPVTISSITIKGTNASDFYYGSATCPVSPDALAAGQTCFPLLRFRPTAVGLRLATLVIQVAGGSTQTVLLTGDGVTAYRAIGFSAQYLNFPELPLGDQAATGQMWVFNTGTATVNIQTLEISGPDAADFHLTVNHCDSVTLPAGNKCLFDVQFQPTALGPRRANAVVTDDVPGNQQNMPLLGFGGPPQVSLQLFPPQLAFNPTGAGNMEQLMVTVSNSGSQPVTINSLTVAGRNAADFTLSPDYCAPLPMILAAAAFCDLYVNFTPASAGARVASLEVASTAPGSPQSIPLEGVGQRPVIDLTYSPDPLVLGSTPLGQQVAANVNLTNQGAGTAQLSFEVGGANAGDFSMPTYCPPLGPGGWCGLSVNFTPKATGLREATLTATDSVSGQRQTVVLAGGGTVAGAPLVVTPAQFQPVVTGGSSSGTVTIGNTSSSPVTISGLTLAGDAKADFNVFENGCRAGTTVPSNNSCGLVLTFTPMAAGTRMANLSVSYGGGSQPIIIPVAGLGLRPAGAVTFSPAEASFGGIQIGNNATFTAYINNSGDVPVEIQNVSITGAAAGDFAVIWNQCPYAPATLQTGLSCYLTLQFAPTAAGSRVANLQVSDNAAGSPQNLPIIGFGTVNAPAILLFGATSFIAQPLNSSTSGSITAELQGGAPVTFSSVAITGPAASDFVLANGCPTTLLPATGSCTLTVTFTPSVTGLRSAQLVVKDNAIGSPQILPLAGWGIVATTAISFSPVPLTFSQVQGIGSSGSAYVQITNTGSAPVQLTGFRISGTDAQDFGIESNTCVLAPLTMPTQTTCSVFIVFSPTATGARVATLTVTDSAAGSPQSISIVGAGAPAIKTLALSPATVEFSPTPVGSTDSYGGSANITNTGNVPVSLTGFRFSGADASDFSIAQNQCQLTLNAGDSCQVAFSFTPAATGARSAVFTVESDATPSKQSVQLSGTGE